MMKFTSMAKIEASETHRHSAATNCRTALRSALLLCLAIAGCSRSIAIDIPAQTLTVLVYSQGTATAIATQRCDIAPGSEKFRKLKQLLQQNSAGWRTRSADYTPSIVVIGPAINLYFAEDFVVMNYSGGEYFHPLARDSYQFLDCGTT
jgi:hypothetical protein